MGINKPTKKKLTIALAQIQLVKGDPIQNGKKVAEWTKEAASTGADLLLLPELWASGYDLEHAERLATDRFQGSFLEMNKLSEKYQISLGGSLLERGEKGIYNTFALYQPKDYAPMFYRKIHLFSLLKEDKWLKPGSQLVTASSPWGLSGLAICYDMRFPELFRKYAEAGAQIVLVSAVWPQQRVIHWQKLLQARAIENQYFIAAVNRVGSLDGEKLGGCSTVVNPMGEPMLEMNDQEKLLLVEIDLREVEKTRRWMPVLDDRREDVYG